MSIVQAYVLSRAMIINETSTELAYHTISFLQKMIPPICHKYYQDVPFQPCRRMLPDPYPQPLFPTLTLGIFLFCEVVAFWIHENRNTAVGHGQLQPRPSRNTITSTHQYNTAGAPTHLHVSRLVEEHLPGGDNSRYPNVFKRCHVLLMNTLRCVFIICPSFSVVTTYPRYPPPSCLSNARSNEHQPCRSPRPHANRRLRCTALSPRT